MQKLFKYFALYFLIIYFLAVIVPYICTVYVGTDFFENTTEELQIIPKKKIDITENMGEFILYDVATGVTKTVSDKDFLVGSLMCEMSEDVPMEAMKAQTVAAFSYYSCIRNENVGKSYHVSYNSELGSVYKESSEEHSVYKEAVESVYNQILTYEEQIAYASFFTSSNGLTESAFDLWGKEYPYLVSVASPYDTLNSGYERTYYYSIGETQKKVSELWGEDKFDFNMDYANWFSDIKHTIGSTVVSVNICGFSVTGSEFMACFGLSSPCFDIEYDGENFVFTSRGQGSLVGMSQVGAVYMASEGADYKEILKWYYPNTEIVNLT